MKLSNNIITKIKTVGYPGVSKRNNLKLDKNGYELNLDGMYVLPGFIDMHGHIGGVNFKELIPDYVFKLWLAHGITTSKRT